MSKRILVVMILILILVFAYVEFMPNTRQADDLGTQSPDMESLFAEFPDNNAPDSQKQAWHDKISGYAKDASKLEIVDCKPNPPILKLKQNQELLIANKDNKQHTITHGPSDKPELTLMLESGSEKPHQLSFANPGTYGYKCDDVRAGIFLVTSQ